MSTTTNKQNPRWTFDKSRLTQKFAMSCSSMSCSSNKSAVHWLGHGEEPTEKIKIFPRTFNLSRVYMRRVRSLATCVVPYSSSSAWSYHNTCGFRAVFVARPCLWRETTHNSHQWWRQEELSVMTRLFFFLFLFLFFILPYFVFFVWYWCSYSQPTTTTSFPTSLTKTRSVKTTWTEQNLDIL